MEAAEVGEWIDVEDRNGLEEVWRPCSLEKVTEEPSIWSLLDKDGSSIDEPPDCPAAGFSEAVRSASVAFEAARIVARAKAKVGASGCSAPA